MRLITSTMAIACLIAGCAVSPGLAPSPGPTATMAPDTWCPSTPPPSYAPATVNAENVAGDWVGLSGDPESNRPISVCDRVPFVLRLQQAGSQLKGEVLRMDGYVYLFDMALLGVGTVSGKLEAGRVTLNGVADEIYITQKPGTIPVRYDLQFEPATQRLVGTLNEKRVWLVPRVLQTPCPIQRPCDPVI